MLDKQTAMMLRVASLLTAEELDQIRSASISDNACSTLVQAEVAPPAESEMSADEVVPASAQALTFPSGAGQGDRERLRTRESKIATACVGQPRTQHDWWPIGTELIGRMGPETFTAVVVRNPQVKSGRSIQITSGSANGRICRTPTRAALEATEAYRQASNLGRAGGVTNGWDFWKPKH